MYNISYSDPPESDGGVVFVQTVVALSSFGLVGFYVFQYTKGCCNILPIYVQLLTGTVYASSVFTDSQFVYVPTVQNYEVVFLPIGRWLFWIAGKFISTGRI